MAAIFNHLPILWITYKIVPCSLTSNMSKIQTYRTESFVTANFLIGKQLQYPKTKDWLNKLRYMH